MEVLTRDEASIRTTILVEYLLNPQLGSEKELLPSSSVYFSAGNDIFSFWIDSLLKIITSMSASIILRENVTETDSRRGTKNIYTVDFEGCGYILRYEAGWQMLKKEVGKNDSLTVGCTSLHAFVIHWHDRLLSYSQNLERKFTHAWLQRDF